MKMNLFKKIVCFVIVASFIFADVSVSFAANNDVYSSRQIKEATRLKEQPAKSIQTGTSAGGAAYSKVPHSVKNEIVKREEISSSDNDAVTEGSNKHEAVVKDMQTIMKKPDSTSISSYTKSHYDSVDLVWKKVPNATGYRVYRSTERYTGYACVKTIESNVNKWTDKGLNGKVRYYYKVLPFRVVADEYIFGCFSNVYAKELKVKNLEELTTYYLTAPYKHGGNTPKGWDCSGFTQWANWFMFGKKIPRTGTAQAAGGVAVNKNKMSTWKPGDVLIWSYPSGGVSHVSLYIGNGKMMHALNEKYDTLIQDVSYYEKWDTCNYLSAVRRYSGL